ncbi:30S ribosomal protein S8 chloroplastic, partial [Bienertia sinuspersici]
MNKKGKLRIVTTNITEDIVKILLREGFSENARKIKKETNIFWVSRPGLQIYSNYQRIPRILGGMRIAILSTSRGIMMERKARLEGIGGEILCYI